MLTFVFLLAIASFAMEMTIASKIPAMRRIAKNYVLANLAISIGISYSIGILFGAVGLIAMTAAIASTLMSIPGYQYLYWCHDSPQALAVGGNMYAHTKSQLKTSISKWGVLMKDFKRIVYVTLKTVTFPIWFTRSIVSKLSKNK